METKNLNNMTWNWHIHHDENGKIAFVCASVQTVKGEYVDGASSTNPISIIDWVKANYPQAILLAVVEQKAAA